MAPWIPATAYDNQKLKLQTAVLLLEAPWNNMDAALGKLPQRWRGGSSPRARNPRNFGTLWTLQQLCCATATPSDSCYFLLVSGSCRNIPQHSASAWNAHVLLTCQPCCSQHSICLHWASSPLLWEKILQSLLSSGLPQWISKQASPDPTPALQLIFAALATAA